LKRVLKPVDWKRFVMSSVSFARAELLKGLSTGSIRLAFQPQVDLVTQKIVAFEGVARWHHDKLGVMTPGLFLGLAAREGLLSTISRALVADAAKAVCSWRARGHRVDVAINLSAGDMTDPEFGRDILVAVREHGALPHWIILEASEEALAFAGEAALAGLEALAGLGFKIALDAKGPPTIALDKRARALFCQLKCGGNTMLSVASQLHSVGASSFMRRLDAARAADLPVVAVGAESQDAMDLCLQLGFTRLQGKIISMPVSVDRCSFYLDRVGVHGSEQPVAEPISIQLEPAMTFINPPVQALDLVETVDVPAVEQPTASHKNLTIFSLDFSSNDDEKQVEAA
jgi:EAL domain-containing protein (putative c-di-GMP-specific phosphodiesterase class I)